MNRTLTFKAEDRLMKDVLFANDVRFRIPRYQRPYAWGDDDVEEFWNDLLQEETLFIGSMIFNYEHERSENYIDVIDGQQRLLSITILEAVLRDVTSLYDPELSRLIHEFEIALKDRHGNQDYRILCGDTTQPFFGDYVQKGNANIRSAKTATAEERRIKGNYSFFFQRVNAELDRLPSNEQKLECLKAIRRKLETLIVIHVRIDSEEEAYEIFETTNARGVDLSVADLLKNLIFKKIRVSEGIDEAKDKWEEMRADIQETGTELKRFIRYYWISKHKPCPEKRLFREIKRATTDWQGLLDDLRHDADIFNDLYECNEADWMARGIHPDTYRSLLAIKRMNYTISYIFLVRLFSNLPRLGLNPRSVVRTIERFTFLYSAVSRQPINKCEKVYSEQAKQLHEAVQVQDPGQRRVAVEKVLTSLRNALIALVPPREVFKEAFMTISYKKNSQQARDFVRYILDAVNAGMASTNELVIDPYNVNTEHVLPQSPAKKWGLSKRDVAPFVNLLGNLTLVDKRINSLAGNDDLAAKLDVLEKSELPVTKVLVDEIRGSSLSWGQAEIENRQARLADIAYDTAWKIT
ncbi:MAG: DUF262 domain-containing HNH endonuclease family protein [Gammaproteobacteria bacterium]|nr:DUF262 domain-containing HNH endonuclease family protein [Gammaproteobacteria bacterium]